MKKANNSEIYHRLLEKGTANIINTGFHNTSINEIVSSCNIPKGSFYYYFDSKEYFACCSIEHYTTTNYYHCNQVLDDTFSSPISRLRSYFECLVKYYEKNNFMRGCLLGNLSLEMSDINATIRQKVKVSFDKWENDIYRTLLEAIEIGEVTSTIDPRSLASFCINSWQGALVRMKSENTVTPLANFIDLFFTHVLVSKSSQLTQKLKA